MRKSYELALDAPSAMSWDEYARTAIAEYRALIAVVGREKESVIHEFFERNPSFVPGAFSYPRSGHAPIHWGVFSKPRLSGEPGYIPDFLWLATATDCIYPIFVEIETPAKRWFTASGQATSEWTQAHDQILNWKRWLKNPSKMQAWIQSLRLPSQFSHDYELHPQFVLIYGSAKEFEERPELRSKRKAMESENTVLITFDNLVPDANADDFMSLRRRGQRVVAITVPPTFRPGPNLGLDILDVEGRVEAVRRESRMTQSRREFLAKRIPYWDSWMKSGARGMISTGDRE